VRKVKELTVKMETVTLIGKGRQNVTRFVSCVYAIDSKMLGVSVRKVKELTVKVETVTLIGKGRQNVTCFVYCVYVINSKIFFLIRHLISRRSSKIWINTFLLGRLFLFMGSS
jgi:predicted RNA-binding protein with TRAM domain